MPQQRLTLVALVLVLAVGLLVFWGTRPLWSQAVVQDPPVEPVEQAELRPSQTRRGSRLWSQRARWIERHPLAEPEVTGLPIALTGDLVRPRALRRAPDIRPERALPDPDEAPLPRGAPTQALAALLHAQDTGSAELADLDEAFRQAARKARLDPTVLSVVDDPWRAVLVLEAERRRALAARDGESTAAGQWVFGLAHALVLTHPQAPAADHARLFLLDVLGRSEWDTADPHRLAEACLEALAHSQDSLVRTLALSHLERATPYAEDLLPVLAGAWQAEHPDPWLAAAAADHAVAAGDPEATRTWLDRLRTAVASTCDPSAPSSSCRAWRLELRWSEAQLAATLGLEPVLPEDRLTTAAWRCQIWRHPLGPGELSLALDEAGWRILGSRGEADPTFVSDCMAFEAAEVPLGEIERVVLRQQAQPPRSHMTP